MKSSRPRWMMYCDESSDEEDLEEEDLCYLQVMKQLKNEVSKVLTRIHEKKAFEFAVGRISTELPSSPGIKIPGYGPVSLPVTENVFKDLKKWFHEAPYGLGEATIIDKTVRDSWQLDPKDFVISNPNFNAGVEKLVKGIQDDLNCSEQKVTSHLYKLLLYERGGHFKPHRDTEKHKGMFATLIIQLPSIFTGGDLVVKHGSREKRIVFGNPQSEFSCMYAAHYADCEHELTEITSGYRMALVYSLCTDGNGVVPTPPDAPTTKLTGLLQNLNEDLPHPSMIAWGLDYHYSESSFLNKGIQALKGGDKHIYSSLKGVNDVLEEDKKLDFFLVEATRFDHLYGYCKDSYDGYHCGDSITCFEVFDGDDDWETDFSFKVIGSNGKPWKRSSYFHLDFTKDVLNISYDDDEFWGKCNIGECKPSGNEGTSKTNWYRRYLLVIIPRKNAFKIVCMNGIESAIDYLAQKLEGEVTPSLRKLAVDIVDLCVKEEITFCEDDKNVATMFTLILKLKELDLAKKILPLLSEPLVINRPYVQAFNWNSQQSRIAFGIPSKKIICLLTDLVSAFGWQPLSNALEGLVHACSPRHYKNVVTFLEQCPGVVPKDDLIISMVQRVVNIAASGENLTDESLMAICLFLCNHLQTCSQFLQPFLDTPILQNLQMLSKVLVCLKNRMDEIKDNKFYQMSLTKFWEQLQVMFQAVESDSTLKVDDIVKGTNTLICLQEDTLIEKLVEQVLQNPNENLLKKLLAGCVCHSVDIPEPVKHLILARINQLLPLVQAGKPVVNWCQSKADLPKHPEVQAFLRGPNQHFVYDKFRVKNEAKTFARNFKARENGTYSAAVKVVGCHDGTQVEITKVPADKNKHKEALKKYAEDCEELKRLQSVINGQ